MYFLPFQVLLEADVPVDRVLPLPPQQRWRNVLSIPRSPSPLSLPPLAPCIPYTTLACREKNKKVPIIFVSWYVNL